MKTERKNIYQSLLLLVILGCCCWLLIMKWRNGCVPFFCPIERDFSITDLELPATLFPNNSEVNNLTPFRRQTLFADEYSQVIYWSTETSEGQARLLLLEGDSIIRGATLFRQETSVEIIDESQSIIEQYPTIANYVANNADLFEIKCGLYLESKHACVFYAKYDEYFIRYLSTLDDVMQEENFLNVVNYVDGIMKELLN